MEKVTLNVPKGIRYLSEWEDFKLSKFSGHCILHKQLPGCGFTELALTEEDENEVVCSPRRILMENKKEQHGDDVYLVVNEFDSDADFDEDVTKPETTTSSERKDKDQEFLNKLKEQATQENSSVYIRLYNEIKDYINRRLYEKKSVKIIVTYDSAYLVKKILQKLGQLGNFKFVVDEFQSILEDSRFKSSVEVEFLSILQDIPNVMYVSATPMLDNYLSRIPELNSLPYYQLDWEKEDPMRIKKPNLKVRSISSVSSKINEIIKSYLEESFEKVVVERNGELVEVESREAVFFVNSVNHIVTAIKKARLCPNQVNILCSNTPENQRKIWKKLGKKSGFNIGSVPLKGSKHKMFTFCTRTVYLGADFYSVCARSFIFSDSNSDCLSVDISMDLAQILGRQRLDENPWKNSAEFFYRTTCDWRKKNRAELNNIISAKLENTEALLRSYENSEERDKSKLAKVYQYMAKSLKYKDNYVAVNRRVGDELVPCFNNLVLINEERAFDIQQIDYKDRFSVFCSLEKEFDDLGEYGNIASDFFTIYDQFTTYIEKSKFICEYLINNPMYRDIILSNLSDSDIIKQQIISIGESRIKGLGYNLTRINTAMGIEVFDISILLSDIFSSFNVGERHSKKFIKQKLNEIYKNYNYNRTAKASDLERWFEVKECKLVINSKREAGFELIKKK